MATQAKTPTKRPTKAAATPKTEATSAPVAVEPVAVEAAPAPVAAEPAPAPVAVEPAPAPKPVEAPAAAPVVTASVAAGFEFPKFELPKWEMPKFEVPGFEMPKFDVASLDQAEVAATFRDFAEKAVAQAKAGYDKIREATEEATDALEDTYEAARAGLVEYSGKSIEAVKTNSNAALGHAKDLLGVKTFAEAIELQSTFVRQQYEAISAQAKELQELATKVAGEASKPAKDVLGKAVEIMKKAD